VTALLSARGLTAGYAGASVVRGVDIEVHPGEVVALLGPNGAGKTTTMLTLAGELRPQGGEVSWLGEQRSAPLHRRARRGLGFVSEERSIFTGLTVKQNLAVGGCAIRPAVELFPELAPLLSRRAGLLSGGEQQMLTLARALGRRPRLLLADELSLGMAPRVVGRLLAAVRAAADQGMGTLLVEQHVHRVLDVADRFYVLSDGEIRLAGVAGEADDQFKQIEAHYLGRAREGFNLNTTVTDWSRSDKEVR
jgi:ABC-type branched-subunit amino acid transport system ATPase component